MPIFTIVGAFFGSAIFSFIVSAIAKLIFKSANKSYINAGSVLVVALCTLTLGVESFIVYCLVGVPVWYMLNLSDRQREKSTLEKP